MLVDEIPLNFKDAVFATENAYTDGLLDIDVINNEIDIFTELVQMLSNSNLITYEKKDKDIIGKHAALFKTITDTSTVVIDSTHIYEHMPYTYDFEDVWGQSDWRQMFVSKLLETGKGNCHSLPYLYKILSDELKIPCYLAFAPNHIYIKLFSEETGWYNTELTSGTFPVDAWIIASGYVNTDAIRNGLYMDALSDKQAVANCLLDLAQGYQHKYGKENPEFVVKCCNTVLQYHPANVNAMLTKAEAQKFYIQSQTTTEDTKEMYADMEASYVKLHQLGYRRMPEKMYLEWVGLLTNDKYMNRDFKSNKHVQE
ncbi:MAG: hypothetical protein LBN93_11680 [Candidatus Symbiothrix sp.]|nr:hypothetical protein [Candidatus Symbiothrix sp.]